MLVLCFLHLTHLFNPLLCKLHLLPLPEIHFASKLNYILVIHQRYLQKDVLPGVHLCAHSCTYIRA